jgi:hypothetical protein
MVARQSKPTPTPEIAVIEARRRLSSSLESKQWMQSESKKKIVCTQTEGKEVDYFGPVEEERKCAKG